MLGWAINHNRSRVRPMYSIYVLINKEVKEVGYLGITSISMDERLSEHKTDMSMTTKCRWIRDLVKNGNTLIIREIYCVKGEERARAVEHWFIKEFSDRGIPITNSTIPRDVNLPDAVLGELMFVADILVNDLDSYILYNGRLPKTLEQIKDELSGYSVLRTADVVKVTGMSKSKISRLINDGKMTAKKGQGGYTYYPEDIFMAYARHGLGSSPGRKKGSKGKKKDLNRSSVDLSEIVNASVLADYLSVDIHTVYRWTKSDKIPHIVLPGGQYRYVLKEVLDALKENVR